MYICMWEKYSHRHRTQTRQFKKSKNVYFIKSYEKGKEKDRERKKETEKKRERDRN